MKFDIEKLRNDIKATAAHCVTAKTAFREAQRHLSAVDPEKLGVATYEVSRRRANAVNDARCEAQGAALDMTKLCVLRAHLRGREHLSSGSSLGGFVKQWVEELAPGYAIAEQKPAA